MTVRVVGHKVMCAIELKLRLFHRKKLVIASQEMSGYSFYCNAA